MTMRALGGFGGMLRVVGARRVVRGHGRRTRSYREYGRVRGHAPRAARRVPAAPSIFRRTLLNKNGLSSSERDRPVGHLGREHEIVRDHERRPPGCLRPQQRGELVLPLRVDSARRLVEDEEVGIRDQHRCEREPLPLAARQIAWMPSLEAREPDLGESGRGARDIAADAERDLVLGTVADEVPPGILREVRSAAVPLDRSRVRFEQPARPAWRAWSSRCRSGR